MSCNNYENCSKDERSTLQYPMDNRSLYANRVYDNQTSNRRCYESNPINIIEGFGFSSNDMIKNILKLAIIILVLYVIYAIIMDFNKKEVKLGVATQNEASISSLKF
ncbi:MAG: hypothetical protein Homavirus10_4 [Homavirus sp.]|uniref:Uncharacterized protein n=1 Tax=Homavirus sp. TaxID=2487769 RepID=A0A3G5A4H8_9VIRU|nr:MAG: hypothetical protein Homavirus10_4 [Homavirus sp.]